MQLGTSTAAGVSFEELLEHLVDLSSLGAAEGYMNFARGLAEVQAAMLCQRHVYAARIEAPPPRARN